MEFWARKLERKYTPSHTEIIKIQFWGMNIGDGGDKIEIGIAGFVDGKHPGSKSVNKIHVFDDTEVCCCYFFFFCDLGLMVASC